MNSMDPLVSASPELGLQVGDFLCGFLCKVLYQVSYTTFTFKLVLIKW